ncbi:hypothetical protein UP10_31520 [Bradyrhizobium sp. LTSPM299]|uniref:hypothetical protein n=1 Tax=Bradyrhizobium sp. LTSPM299 TaxID=1619233 RepID=UPI0005C914B1|nr:hypothetical protein [Bradyrhizobium sp. LTSPM299]KJC56979.1 hypothetical protein UP10_31520 [Bradyrhizobium sp. LTSPM299]
MSEDEPISDDDRTNEVGFFNTAETYWRSAQALYNAKVKATHPLSPVLFLYYHAIELYFKAFLRGHGFTAAHLRSKKFGHRVCCLSERAAELGLSYMDEDKQVFSMMITTDAIIRSRYILTGYHSWPSPEALDRTCRGLRESVCKALVQKGSPVRL